MYTDKKIRVVIKEGEPWFVAADVCKVLEIGNPTDALSKRLDEEEKATTIVLIEGGNGAHANKEVNIVNEPGLYSLVLGSRKPEVKSLQELGHARWV